MAISNKDKPVFAWLSMYYLLNLRHLGKLDYFSYGKLILTSDEWYVSKKAIQSKLIKELTKE